MSKKMCVTIDFEVEDLPEKELEECADLANMKVEELVCLKDLSAAEIATVLDGGILSPGPFGVAEEEICRMLFEGSDMFVTFKSAEVKEAKWLQV